MIVAIGKWKWDRNRSYRNREYNSLPDEVRVASWPSRDEETPQERAIRLYLQEKGEWNEALDPQPSETDRSTDIPVDDPEFFITSRPWYVWELEVAEEERRIRRHPDTWDLWDRQRNNVTARWKEAGNWKESWGEVPGWKWRHESSSPEPADPNDMEFTPSEIGALEEIPPPSPPPAPKPSSLEPRGPVWNRIFGWLPGNDPDLPPPPGRYGDQDGKEPAATAEPIGDERPKELFETRARTTSHGDRGELPSPARPHRRGTVRGQLENNSEQRHWPIVERVLRSATHPACSTARTDNPSRVARTTQRGKNAWQSSKIAKPAPRRSARIAARKQASKSFGIPSETEKAGYHEDPAP